MSCNCPLNSLVHDVGMVSSPRRAGEPLNCQLRTNLVQRSWSHVGYQCTCMWAGLLIWGNAVARKAEPRAAAHLSHSADVFLVLHCGLKGLLHSQCSQGFLELGVIQYLRF